jgi:glutaredoxin 3
VDYRNAKANKADLAEMLKHTLGQRDVPVIVENGRVTIGYGGT